MSAELGRLRRGELIAGVCAVLLFIDLFLKWYGVKIGGAVESVIKANGGSLPSVSAWEVFSYTDLLLFLVIVVTLVWIGLTLLERAPALPVAFSVIVTALAAFATLIVLLRLLNQPGPNDLVTVEYGAWLGLLLIAGITAGGFMAMNDEGTSLADARRQAEELVSSRGTSQPAGGSAPPASESAREPESAPPPASESAPPASEGARETESAPPPPATDTAPASTPPTQPHAPAGGAAPSEGGSTPPPSSSPPPSSP
jgi:hypothetical protein